ncbi:MAG: hypothetical protein ACOYNN_15930 [Terrimicrobiaceae bacterium]
MKSVIQSKLRSIEEKMLVTIPKTKITPPIAMVALKLLKALHISKIKPSGGSETQKSSLKSEKDILTILGLPNIPKVKNPKENSTCLSMNPGYYNGFKRTVKKPNKCNIIVPEADGVYVVHQPFGSQANPDILILDVRSGKIVCEFGIEVKSGGPTWNTHIQTMDRTMMYIAIKKNEVHCFFGEHVRDKESLLIALVWDELQRELANELNAQAKKSGKKNLCVAYPKQEFTKLNLNEGREERHMEIKEWFESFLEPSASPKEQEQHSQLA